MSKKRSFKASGKKKLIISKNDDKQPKEKSPNKKSSTGRNKKTIDIPKGRKKKIEPQKQKFNQLNKTPTKKGRQKKRIWLQEAVREKVDLVNELLKDVRTEHPEFLRQRWNGMLEQIGTKERVTKDGRIWQERRFRKLTDMNMQQLKDYINLLDDFFDDIEQQYEDYQQYDDSGYGYMFGIVDLLEPKYYDYYYWNQYDEWVMITKSVIQTRLESGQSLDEIERIIENAFYTYGDFESQNKPSITGYVNAISENAKYL